MTVDVRAKVFCNLGTVIQANIADEALSARQGLIRCRGQVVLEGLLTPQVGRFVYFGWERDGTIARIPRTLRVLSSFANPFTRQTTVQLGDKLVYLANLRGRRADPSEQEPKPETPNQPPVPDPQLGPEPFDYPASDYDYDQEDSCYLPRPGQEPYLFGNTEAAEQIQALEPYLMEPASIKNRAPLTISASSVLGKCLAGLGLASTGASLVAQFTQDTFDLSSGYVNVIDQLLANESLYGYLNEDEVLVINLLNDTPANGPLITSDTLIDLSGINQGILPGQQVTVSFQSLDLNPEPPPEPDPPPDPDAEVEQPEPEADPGPNDDWDDNVQPPEPGSTNEKEQKRDWEYEQTVAYNQTAKFYLEDGFEFTFPYTTATETYTFYDEDDYVTKRITKRFTILAAEAGSILQASLQAEYDSNTSSQFRPGRQLQQLAGRTLRSGTREEFTYRVVKKEDKGLPQEQLCPSDEPRVVDEIEPERVEKLPVTQTTYNFQSSLTLLGQLNISGVDWAEYPIASLPNFDVLTDKTIVTYSQNEATGQTKTTTERFVIHGNTQQGQQDTAEKGKATVDATTINKLLAVATDLRQESVEVSIQQDRTYGVQKRPSETDLIKENQKIDPPVASSKDTTTNTQEVQVIQESDTTESQSDLLIDMPYGSDDGFVWTASDGFEFRGSNAAPLALRYARTQNAILRGNRAGVSLQLPAYVMPLYPLRWVYLQAANVTGGYRANGMSWAINSEGLLCSMDALFWGGVSGSGTAWFPVAPGITSLPADPSVTAGSGTPANAMTTPAGFNATAPGGIWSTLPVATEPSYPASITPTGLVPVVEESVQIVAGTRTVLSVTALEYALTLPTATQVLVSKTALQVAVRLQADAGAISTTGQDAVLKRFYEVTAQAGSIALTGYGAGSVRDYAIGTNAGTFAFSGQNAIAAYQRAPLSAEAGSYVLTGQNADKRVAITMPSSAGAFVFTGIAARFSRSLLLSAGAGSFSSTGEAAQLNYITPSFAITSYTGNQTARSFNTGFKPGLVLIHAPFSTFPVFDYVRGPGKYWRTGASNVESLNTSTLSSFDSSGFSLGNSTLTNQNSFVYTAFSWKEGATPASNSDGTLASTTGGNPSAGYSVFTYTGNGIDAATVGHGLGVNPDLVFVKLLDGTATGLAISRLVGADKYGTIVSNTGAWNTSNTVIKGTSSSVLTLGNNGLMNAATKLYTGIAFASVPGVSSISTYTGSGSGTYSVSLGFQPRFVLVKSYNSTSDWFVYFEQSGSTGYAEYATLNGFIQKQTSTNFQITANGFSIDVGGVGNVSGGTSSAIYMAYA